MGLDRNATSLILEVVGALLIVAGAFLVHIWLGLIVAGLLLITFGVAVERLGNGDR